jgi:hypothetical protein
MADGLVAQQFGSCFSVDRCVVFGLFACHAPAPSAWASAAQAPCCFGDVGLICVSPCLLCFLFCMFTLCHPIADMCVNAPPTRLPNLVPFALTQPIMFTARLDALPVSFRVA